jgi:hypothetical protein
VGSNPTLAAILSTADLSLFVLCSRNRAWNPPPSSSLAEEERLCCLLLRAAARDFSTLAEPLTTRGRVRRWAIQTPHDLNKRDSC